MAPWWAPLAYVGVLIPVGTICVAGGLAVVWWAWDRWGW